MASWREKKALETTIFLALMGAGGVWLWGELQGEGSDASDPCHQGRRQILAACEEDCSADPHSLLEVHGASRTAVAEDCIERCSLDRFGRHLPVCGSRRDHFGGPEE